MRKLRALIGMPVVCHNRRIGRLIQPELDAELTRLKGIWVSAGLRGTRYIPAESLQLLGRVAVLTDDVGRRGHMRSAPLFQRATSTDGQRLGAITGAEIDELSLGIVSLELSQGFWDDMLTGRQRIERYTVSRETGEIIIEPNETTREGRINEGWHGQGVDHGNADWRRCGDGLRSDELADGTEMESEGQDDRQLDLRQG